MSSCKIKWCPRDAEVRGYCRPCYQRLRRSGGILTGSHGEAHRATNTSDPVVRYTPRGKSRSTALSGLLSTPYDVSAGVPENVLVIPDTHAPFMHPRALEFFHRVAVKYMVGHVVHIGDEIDFHAISFHDSDPDGMSPGDELAKAKEQLQEMAGVFPEMTILNGNHTVRIQRKLYKHGIPVGIMQPLGSILGAPEGWRWVDEYEHNGVLYLHGTGYGGMYATRRLVLDTGMCVVHGHTHVMPGLLHVASKRAGTTWGMNVGCAVDASAYAFRYAREMQLGTQLTCGVVLDGQPVLVTPPMVGMEGVS